MATPSGFGFLETALGVGAAIGVVTLLWLQRRLPREQVFTTAVVATGTAVILVASVPTLALAILLIACVGAAAGCAYVTGFTLLQESVEDEMRGRMFATLYTVVRVCLLLVADARAAHGGDSSRDHELDVSIRAPRASGRAHRVVDRRRVHGVLRPRRRAGGCGVRTPRRPRRRDVHRVRGRRGERQEHAGRAPGRGVEQLKRERSSSPSSPATRSSARRCATSCCTSTCPSMPEPSCC